MAVAAAFVLAALCAPTAIATVPSVVALAHAGGTSPAGAAALQAVGAPLIRLPHPGQGRSASTGSSTNWAGYDAAGGTFTSVTATWTQPAVSPDADLDTYAAFWVGLDGDTSPTVEQIGTMGSSSGGVVSYLAWYEMYPANPVPINLAVHPGDQFTGSVTSLGSGSFKLFLVNHTTGQSRTFTRQEDPANPALLASAEVIAETPSDSGGVLPLAKFGIVDFSGCAFDAQPISAFDWEQITLAARGGTTLAAALPLGPDGASFFVSDDFTPPVTSVGGAGQMWHHAPARLTLTATDGKYSSGVASTQYSLDGGTTWTPGTALTVAAPADHSNDGLHAVLYRAIDRAGNVERACTVKVGIDTQRPTPVAASPASVKRGHTATIRYSLSDPRPGALTAIVTIRIRTAAGRLVQKAVLARRDVNRPLRHRFLCTLRRGTYRFSVYATDAAGNAQTAAASSTLVVR